MIHGDRHICDRCGASIGNDRVTLGSESADPAAEGYGWIAHFHPDCYAEVSSDIWEVAKLVPEPEPDSVDALEAIPVAHPNVIRGLRRGHRMPDGCTYEEIEREKTDEERRRCDGLRTGTLAPGRSVSAREIADGPGGIGRLPLSPATSNQLRRRNIISISELAALSDDELLAVRGIGPGRLAEIRAALDSHDSRVS